MQNASKALITELTYFPEAFLIFKDAPGGIVTLKECGDDEDLYAMYMRMCSDFKTFLWQAANSSFVFIESLYDEYKFITRDDIFRMSEESYTEGTKFNVREIFDCFVNGKPITRIVFRDTCAVYEEWYEKTKEKYNFTPPERVFYEDTETGL